MKKIILFNSLAFLALTATAQIVTIPDAIFKSQLVSNTGINTNSNTEIETSEAQAVKRLIIKGGNVTSLTGIEAFTGLTYLDCDTNKVTSLDLSANTLLDTLYCGHNDKITSLDFSTLTKLTLLYCPYMSKLTSFKASATPSIKWMDIGATDISSLDMSKQTELKYLDVVYCSSLATIDFGTNTKMESILAMQNPKLLSLDVSLNTNLTTLSLADILSFGSPKDPMTICVSAAQKAAVPSGWTKNASDKYSTTNCKANPTAIDELSGSTNPKTILHIYNLMGQEVNVGEDRNGVFIYQYNDGSVKKISRL